MALADPTVLATAQLGAGVSSLAFPSAGRLILGFLITVALAVGAALVLRKIGPFFRKRGAMSSDVRLIGRSVVSRTLTVHLIEIDGARLAVAEARNGVAITLISSPPSGSAAAR